jgi:peptidoglycan hydrolase-like protein with peptidoglycan-binding domain
MKTKEAIQWFKNTFNEHLEAAVAGTPFSVDMLAAIAHQETGYIWGPLVDKKLSTGKVLALCVGDTLDADKGRTAFPKTKSDLLAAPRGDKMFAIARQALMEMAQYTSSYSGAVKNPNKFCHGFGIFQYDLQFFKKDPAFFLRKKWKDFAACAAKCVEELKDALKRQGWTNKTTLSDTEKVYVAIAYNKGRANPALGFKQGYKSKSEDGRGTYYGENIFEFLRIARSISPRAVGSITTSVAVTSLKPAISAMPEKSHPLLRFGDVGNEVKVLQALLQSHGFFAAALGGHFQEKTRKAVLSFQQANLGRDGKPLKVDGEVGDDTWWALYHPSGMPQKSHPLLRFGDVGDEVKVLQALLQSQGSFAAALGGHFQEKTRQAVLYFQQTHLGRDGKPLEVDGEVGDDTWWALYHPSGMPQKSNIPAILPARLTPMRAKVLKIAAAEHQAGVHEIPDGSNWGDGVIKYLEEGSSPANPWCCFFWNWCVYRALSEHAFGKPIGQVLTTWQQAKTKGWAMDKAGYAPVPGDAFVMLYKDNSGKLTGTGHIGFVLRVDKARNATAFNTVEGNCGNRVKVGRRQMDQSTLVGFINQYSQEKKPRGWETGLVPADDVGAEGTR